jgi:putative endonuclease
MAAHIEVGKEGEKLAEAYLAERGYTFLHRNWRYGRFEIDLIGIKDGMLRFVEVKFRSENLVGNPELSVTPKKIRSLLQAIEQYLFLYPQYNDFRLDVISVIRHSNHNLEYFLIEDVHL